MSKKKAIQREGMSEKKKEMIPSDNPEYASRRQGVFCGKSVEPTPTFLRADCEEILSGLNNNYIVMGRDRPSHRASGYGGKGDTQAGMIDIVVGRMGPSPQDGVYVDPDFSDDAARIYISQKTDLDDNFGIVTGNVGRSTARSGIGMSADSLRFVAREGIKLVTGISDTNSAGAPIKASKYGVDIIANNNDSDLQPIVKGNDLATALQDLVSQVHALNGIVEGMLMEQDKLNKAVKNHWHQSPFFGLNTSPSITVALTASQTVLRHFLKTKTSLRLNRTNLENFTSNYLLSNGAGYINSRYNKVN